METLNENSIELNELDNELLLPDGTIPIFAGQKNNEPIMSQIDDKSIIELKSKNETWQEQLALIKNIASSEFPVLLLGPSGTGKEILAESIHQNSSRRRGPLVKVNCSALTENLVESELFGHVKGSFTSAVADRKGAFETARFGTLFLDEIGDLPLTMQAKILRALENGEIRPVGSDKTIKTNVRVIAATHQQLKAKIQTGEFRQDLFYRLSVITVQLPSLLERMEDFDDLIYKFAKTFRVRFSFNAIQKLKNHKWPGNIRELKNVVARASVLFPKTSIEEHLVEKLLDLSSSFSQTNVPTLTANLPVLKEIERQMIIKRLAANNGNQRRTANDLGMPKSTLNDRLRTYKINPKEYNSRFQNNSLNSDRLHRSST
jgi:DNA-binding NtrC family response regulator